MSEGQLGVFHRVRPVPILVILTILVFAPVWWHDFVNFDDPLYVLDNPIVADGLTWSGVVRAFTMIQAGYWHPLTWLSHMVDIELFGLKPGPHLLVNVLMHTFSTLLLFGVVTRMTGLGGRAFFVAAIFAIHPLRVESVAWVAERKDVLSALFWVLTCSAYLTYVRRPSAVRYGLVALSLVMALLSKPMAVTIPFALLLMDAWPLGRWNATSSSPDARGLWPLVREKLPLIALAVASAVITFLVQRKAGAVQSIDAFPIAARLANVPVAYAKYVMLTIFPWKLAPLYPYPAKTGWDAGTSSFQRVEGPRAGVERVAAAFRPAAAE